MSIPFYVSREGLVDEEVDTDILAIGQFQKIVIEITIEAQGASGGLGPNLFLPVVRS